jgi:DNA-directed RNA polymerase specialized sigma24 family protein
LKVLKIGLTELPVTQREVIVLKIWHEYTFEEIGELLDVSPNTAAGRYRYGLEKMRARLKGDIYERDARARSVGSAVALLDATPPVGNA